MCSCVFELIIERKEETRAGASRWRGRGFPFIRPPCPEQIRFSDYQCGVKTAVRFNVDPSLPPGNGNGIGILNLLYHLEIMPPWAVTIKFKAAHYPMYKLGI